MIVDVVRTASFLEIKRFRRLPYPGQVIVEVGMEVEPEDIIAEAQVNSQVMMLDIARGLGLSPEETTACLIREVDDNLEQGDVIAQCEKTLPRVFRAPVNGKIINYHKGQIVLATKTKNIAISARMIGKVEEVIPEYGAILSARGGLIQGMWGNQLAGSGNLQVIDAHLDKPLEASMLRDLTQNHVIAGGLCLNEEFLSECQSKEIAGLILGSMSADLIPRVRSLTFPVILLQGFDELTPAEDIFDLLQSNNGSVVSLNACQTDYYKGERPEVIIPQEDGTFERALGFRKKLEVGDQVRLISGKAIHQIGKVVELIEIDQVFDNGVTLPSAIVKLPSLEKIKMPQQHLLVVG